MTLTEGARLRQRWGQILRDTLAERDMTPRQFRDALAGEGVDVAQSAIYHWLRGRTAPRADHQAAIGRVLKAHPSVLFPLDEVA